MRRRILFVHNILRGMQVADDLEAQIRSVWAPLSAGALPNKTQFSDAMVNTTPDMDEFAVRRLAWILFNTVDEILEMRTAGGWALRCAASDTKLVTLSTLAFVAGLLPTCAPNPVRTALVQHVLSCWQIAVESQGTVSNT
jgi:hypothetical protein